MRSEPMIWHMKIQPGNDWLTIDDGQSHTAFLLDNVVSYGTTGRAGQDGDIHGFKIVGRDGNAIFFPCKDRKYARFCARRLTNLIHS